MKFYEDLNNIQKNRLAQRSYYIPKNKGAYILLNGEWNFKYYNCDDEYEQNIADWDKIPVPSCWQMYGYEDPNYTNINYPFPIDPPYIPNENPLGVYERTFFIKNEKNKTYIVFEGACSNVELYINESFVGYSQGSHLQSEFDISDFVKKGENKIRVLVRKWCSGSYLEDQDFFRFNGIFRDVYILSRPTGHIKDIKVFTQDNTVNIDFQGKGEISLYDNENLLDKKEASGNVSFTVENPVLWNAEKPYLYTLVFKYEDEIINMKFGFRTIRISDKQELLINDVPVKLKGVNHHDTNAYKGWYESDEDLKKDLEAMKKLNINTIRTSHYPPTSKFLNMCDEMGFYVVLETDLETHGFVTRGTGYGYDDYNNDAWTSNLSEWEESYIERMERAYNRDKNHPCIFMWSTGNESGHGINHFSMVKWIREHDKTRIVHCEDASRKSGDDKIPDDMKEKFAMDSDVYSIMYPSLEWVERYLKDASKKQPYFMCEYAHSMGNGPGTVKEYWDLVYKYPAFIGGCVWEWADHTVIRDGAPRYGGYFEEKTHDHNFCCDGMVFYDRSFKAGSYEIKACYQGLETSFKDGSLGITNRFDFTNLKEYTIKLCVKCDGDIVSDSDISVDLAPHDTAIIDIKDFYKNIKECSLGAFVNITMYDKTGYEVASSQHKLPVKIEKQNIHSNNLCKLRETKSEVIAEGGDFCYTVSKRYGNFTSIVINGIEQLKAPVKLTVWRAPTDNDRHIRKKWEYSDEDNMSGMNFNRLFNKVYSIEIKDGKIVVNGSLAGVARSKFLQYVQIFEIFDNGTIKVSLDAESLQDYVYLPRLGYEFATPYENEEFKYFGMGKYENYCDLNHHTKIDWYESSADEEYVDYIRPQEHGNHTQTKILNIVNGLKFATDTEFEFNVSHYNSYSLDAARYNDQLKKDDAANIRIDYKVSGIGSQSCGPELEEKYKLQDKKMVFSFYIVKK